MAYVSNADGGNKTPTTTPGSNGGYATLDSRLKVTPLPGAGDLEKQASRLTIYFADVQTKKGGTRQQFHSGKFLYDILLDPTRASDEAVRHLQEQLYAGGYYGQTSIKNIRFGDRSDQATRQALARAINAISAQQHGAKAAGAPLQSFFDLLGAKAQYASAKALGGGGPTRAPFAFQPPDPAKLRDAADQVVSPYIGRVLGDAEKNQLVADFTAQLQSAARSAYNVEASGGTATPEPDFEAFAKQRAQQLHPDEAATFQKFGLVNEAMRILGIGGNASG